MNGRAQAIRFVEPDAESKHHDQLEPLQTGIQLLPQILNQEYKSNSKESITCSLNAPCPVSGLVHWQFG
jgi:hypothetical protein